MSERISITPSHIPFRWFALTQRFNFRAATPSTSAAKRLEEKPGTLSPAMRRRLSIRVSPVRGNTYRFTIVHSLGWVFSVRVNGRITPQGDAGSLVSGSASIGILAGLGLLLVAGFFAIMPVMAGITWLSGLGVVVLLASVVFLVFLKTTLIRLVYNTLQG